jgi:Flp pilus assembly protein CpaB
MKATNFDSLTYANRLKAAGMDGGLAEVQASALTEVIQDHFHSLSTKQEVQQLSLDLRKEIQLQGQDLRKDMQLQGQELRKDMQLLEQRMVIKLGSLMVLAIGVVATVVKLI